MSYAPQKKLKNIEEFPVDYVESLANMGINTVGDLQKCPVEALASVVWKVEDVEGAAENSKLTIGVGMAQRLLNKFTDNEGGVAKLDGQYVYRAATSRTLTLQTRGVAYLPDGAGGTQIRTTHNPIHIQFKGARGSKAGAMFILTENVAKEYGKSLAEMKALVEAHDQFGKPYGFSLVAGPEAEKLLDQPSVKSNIISGVRGTGNV